MGHEHRLLDAMANREPVVIRGMAVEGKIDELYQSCWRPGVRCVRVTDNLGRVHHADAARVEVLARAGQEAQPQ